MYLLCASNRVHVFGILGFVSYLSKGCEEIMTGKLVCCLEGKCCRIGFIPGSVGILLIRIEFLRAQFHINSMSCQGNIL